MWRQGTGVTLKGTKYMLFTTKLDLIKNSLNDHSRPFLYFLILGCLIERNLKTKDGETEVDEVTKFKFRAHASSHK